jgi:hypothetical protein
MATEAAKILGVVIASPKVEPSSSATIAFGSRDPTDLFPVLPSPLSTINDNVTSTQSSSVSSSSTSGGTEATTVTGNNARATAGKFLVIVHSLLYCRIFDSSFVHQFSINECANVIDATYIMVD